MSIILTIKFKPYTLNINNKLNIILDLFAMHY